VDELRGDATKARLKLGWEPRTTFSHLVRLMVEADLREAGLNPDEHMVEPTHAPQASA
jgi:GDPmannose 4,6-dehydratase